jgi:hypothetical protein
LGYVQDRTIFERFRILSSRIYLYLQIFIDIFLRYLWKCLRNYLKRRTQKCDEWEICFLFFLLCTWNLYLPHFCFFIFVIINKKYKCRLLFDKAKQIEWKYIYIYIYRAIMEKSTIIVLNLNKKKHLQILF